MPNRRTLMGVSALALAAAGGAGYWYGLRPLAVPQEAEVGFTLTEAQLAAAAFNGVGDVQVITLAGGGLREYRPFAAGGGGATVACPDGPDRVWNDGRWATRRPSVAARDDAGHLLRLAAHLAAGLADRRVFVIGHSNGGGMALALACAAPDRFAGIAIVATKILVEAACPNPAPVPAILFHGTEDRIAPHDGRRTPRQIARMGAIRSSDATLAELARRNRCTGPTRRQTLPALPLSGIVPVIDNATGCAAPLRRVTLRGGGHGFPGSAGGSRRDLIVGPPIPDYDAAAAALAFWGLVPAPR